MMTSTLRRCGKARCGVASVVAGRFIRLAPESHENRCALAFVAPRLRIRVAFRAPWPSALSSALLHLAWQAYEPSLRRCLVDGIIRGQCRIQPSLRRSEVGLKGAIARAGFCP
jgi:hypothetical protein